ncbi:sec-independent protein translocase protein TatC [Desulfotomaculum arcticum]|uniref:Sec-independent protein translocase protein TatC n=1 Tax=Desulfotruncus arcticus DSM 17038 TaxID=1121424 RepID=A0A1I2TYS1_9FIRM|nr:twin-arginine translocase subunit TatC [Desulfotruncus arcticus]SFG70062.1 sec-independent protein translocase protein TatC [Desulfotomaculum arcticum] [Desulfotruncus arcticus DSM 17038]
MTVVEHLEELRRLLIISIVSTFVMAVVCWFFSDAFLKILLEPVTGTGNKIIYIGVTEAVFTKIKLAFFLGFLASLPVTLWQFWGFIIPALRKVERVYFTFFVFTSFILFIGGIAFGFLVVFKMCVSFLMRYGGAQLIPMLTIGNYVSFTLNFLLPFGLIFEMPLASYFLARLGIISYRTMIKGRKFAILAAVIIASAVVASPDIFTVLLFASPIYLLYEISATVVRVTEWAMGLKKSGRTLNILAPIKRLMKRARDLMVPAK